MTRNDCWSGGCAEPATKALLIDWAANTWPDGRPRYVYSCPADVGRVVTAQATRGNTVDVLDRTDDMPNGCVAAWGSHSCNYVDDHDGEHKCSAWKCNSTPGEFDKVFSYATFEPCARTGGVSA